MIPIIGIGLFFTCNISYVDFSHRSLVSYSDGCGGQNKNQTIISLYLELQRMGVYEILDHNFLVRGHTFLENDCNFAQIEKRKNSAKVVLPDDWVQVVRDTTLTKPFQVNCHSIVFVLYSWIGPRWKKNILIDSLGSSPWWI